MKRLRFRPSQRLKSRVDYMNALRQGKTMRVANMSFRIHRNDLGRTRLGIVTGRKLGNAVARNKARRLIREAFRLAQHEIPPGLDVVVLPRSLPIGSVPVLRKTLVAVLNSCAENRGTNHK